jgi:hypothetical protein
MKTAIKKPKEKNVHAQVCQYLKLQYPRAIFNSDLAGLRLTIGQSDAGQENEIRGRLP